MSGVSKNVVSSVSVQVSGNIRLKAEDRETMRLLLYLSSKGSNLATEGLTLEHGHLFLRDSYDPLQRIIGLAVLDISDGVVIFPGNRADLSIRNAEDFVTVFDLADR